jgi:hypothetical protein
MLGMLKRHEIEILLKAGHGKAEVARLSGASLRSVKRIAQEGPVVHIDDAAERAQRQIGRPSTVASFRKLVVEIVALREGYQETSRHLHLNLRTEFRALTSFTEKGTFAIHAAISC